MDIDLSDLEVDLNGLSQDMGQYDEDLIKDLYDQFRDAPEYVDAIVSCLNEVADANITGLDEVVYDLARGWRKASGAEFQLSYILKHKDEIAEVEVPSIRYRQDESVYGVSGADIWNKDGSVTELKSFDFGKSSYRTHAAQSASKVVQQAKRRIDEGASRVDIVFSKWYGDMPEEFRQAMQSLVADDIRISFRLE